MKRISTVFLQGVLVVFGVAVLAFLLWEPHLEGRNAKATTFEIYFGDPFLAFAYFGSIPFFVALFQAIRVLGFAGASRVFSPAAVKAFRTIKYCALATIGFVVVGEIFILLNEGDDAAGGVFMGVLISVASIITAAAAAMFERVLQNGVDLQSENDLTV